MRILVIHAMRSERPLPAQMSTVDAMLSGSRMSSSGLAADLVAFCVNGS